MIRERTIARHLKISLERIFALKIVVRKRRLANSESLETGHHVANGYGFERSRGVVDVDKFEPTVTDQLQ